MVTLKDRLRRRRASKRKPPAVRSPSTGMSLTFRAELMPGRERIERTFQVDRVLENGRVELIDLEGQHSILEFEPLQREAE